MRRVCFQGELSGQSIESLRRIDLKRQGTQDESVCRHAPHFSAGNAFAFSRAIRSASGSFIRANTA
jgi:hypothetical protein